MTNYKLLEDGNLEVSETNKNIRTKEDLEFEKAQCEEELTKINEMLSHFK